jgi:hypothetical protein
MKRLRLSRIASIPLLVALATSSAAQEQTLSPDTTAALNRISADSMRGHLSFIASDRLEGRDTPSRGLDIAAEYIAAQFRRAGLEPVGDDGYFQTAPFVLTELDPSSFQLTVRFNGQEVQAAANQVSFNYRPTLNWNSESTPIVKVAFGDTAALSALTVAQTEGKVIFTEVPDPRVADRAQTPAVTDFLSRLAMLKPAMIASINRSSPTGTGGGPVVLAEQGATGAPGLIRAITVHAPAVVTLFDALPLGVTTATVSTRARGIERPVPLRNVVGVLRGADPVLSNSYVFLTAHYDHVGTRGSGPGDNIFNGANDDGSGTVSVIEIASALATLKERPKRSLVFMTVFGEEKGLLGSSYYLRHPIFPIDKTVADINLEQVGRTDSTEGPQVNNASVTGFDFSEVGQILVAAGKLTAIDVYKHERNSDAYFSQSDNVALASQGVPAHSFSVAFDYPDYHRPGDHWEKIDYANMARVDRTVALALMMIANNPEAPKWNEANPKTAPYVRAWKERHPESTK